MARGAKKNEGGMSISRKCAKGRALAPTHDFFFMEGGYGFSIGALRVSIVDLRVPLVDCWLMKGAFHVMISAFQLVIVDVHVSTGAFREPIAV